MQNFAERAVQLLIDVHPLDRVPRAGYVLRGVAEPESVAAHSHTLALLALLFVEAHPDRFDGRKAVAMALIHDLAEARTMDIPNPACTPEFKAAKGEAEQAILDEMFAGLPPFLSECHRELRENRSPEARLVHALDKVQMMARVMVYGWEGRGRLEDFWENPANFEDYGIEPVAAIFDTLCARAGRPRPRQA